MPSSTLPLPGAHHSLAQPRGLGSNLCYPRKGHSRRLRTDGTSYKHKGKWSADLQAKVDHRTMFPEFTLTHMQDEIPDVVSILVPFYRILQTYQNIIYGLISLSCFPTLITTIRLILKCAPCILPYFPIFQRYLGLRFASSNEYCSNHIAIGKHEIISATNHYPN